MYDEFLILNIRDFLREQGGENMLEQIFSTFSCQINTDVERFLCQQSVEFTKKNQSVTYIVMTPDYSRIVGYFTIAIKPITINAYGFSNTVKRKIARVSEQNPTNGTYSLSAYLIAQLGKNFQTGYANVINGTQLLGLAIEKVKEIQYMTGGMVVFLEAENKEKLLSFYERNGFKKFDVRQATSKNQEYHELVQLLSLI